MVDAEERLVVAVERLLVADERVVEAGRVTVALRVVVAEPWCAAERLLEPLRATVAV